MARKKPKEWEEFEKQVASLFELKGFEVSHDTHIANRQTDILLRHPEQYIGGVLVECKYHDPTGSGKVSVTDVESLASRTIRLRNSGEISAGYLVTNTRFTATASGQLRGRPEEFFVFIKTFDELLRELIDFKSYLEHFSRNYSLAEQRLFEPLDIIRDKQKHRISFSEEMRNFFNNEEENLIVVLGDYGTGKTTSCRQLAYELSQDVLNGKSGAKIPCFIPLKFYNYSGSARPLVAHFLNDIGLPSVSYEAFSLMNESGLLVLILDGFDEMAKRVTKQVRSECFETIGNLCLNNSKVILSGRPGYFPNGKELAHSLQLLKPQSSRDRLRGIIKRRKGEEAEVPPLVSMAPLNPQQVRSFLGRRLIVDDKPPSEARLKKIQKRIYRIYNLEDLCTRPILLEMIAETIEDIESEQIANAAELYELYVRTWLDNGAEKGTFRLLVSKEVREDFSVALAWVLLTSQTDRIQFRDLNTAIAKYFDIDEQEEIDHFSSVTGHCRALFSIH